MARLPLSLKKHELATISVHKANKGCSHSPGPLWHTASHFAMFLCYEAELKLTATSTRLNFLSVLKLVTFALLDKPAA